MPIFLEKDFALNGHVLPHAEGTATTDAYDSTLWSIRETQGDETRFLAANLEDSSTAYDLIVYRKDLAKAEGLAIDLSVVWPGRMPYAIEHERAQRKSERNGLISDEQLSSQLESLNVPVNLVNLLVQDISSTAREKYFKDI